MEPATEKRHADIAAAAQRMSGHGWIPKKKANGDAGVNEENPAQKKPVGKPAKK
jgi:hypothetical protein